MIARLWRAETTMDKASDYGRHFAMQVAPHLRELAGHQGAYLLRRDREGKVSFLAITMWDSLESVRAFSGANPDVAVVEPAARKVLSRFDKFVEHFDVVHQAAFRP